MRSIVLLLLLLTVIGPSPAWSRDDLLRIGILAYRPLPQEAPRWEKLAPYLQSRLPGATVRIEVLDYAALDAALRAHRLDAVLTNPGHYLLAQRRHGLGRAIATLVRQDNGQMLAGFGGVAFTRAAREDLRDWPDLVGKTIAYVAKESLGGYQMQAYELLRRGLDPKHAFRPLATGMPHDKVVEAVLQGQADAGFVRDGVLEAMAREGKLDAARVRVLAPQPLGAYPYVVSTPLYPEWPFAVMQGLSPRLASALAIALIEFDQQAPALARELGIQFTLPADYSPVEDLLHALALPPFEPVRPGWRDLVRFYWPHLAAGAAALLLLALLLLRQQALTRRLGQALTREQATARELTLLAHTFESAEGIVICDATGRIERVNAAFERITGYGRAEAWGKKPGELLASGRHDAAFYRAMWAEIIATGSWKGEIWNRRKNGHIYPEYLTISAIRDDAGNVRHYVGTFSDISALKAAETRIHELAFYDPLTGLANRLLAKDRLGHAMHKHQRLEAWGAVLFIDLDHFKDINDTLGHETGDHCLVTIASRMKEVVRESDTLARLGGDEFLLILENLHTSKERAGEQAEDIARKLIAAIEQPLHLAGQTHQVSASIGIALFDGGEARPDDLLKQADLAMYAVKASGRGDVRFFDTDMETRLAERLQLEKDLRAALARGELRLYCQPQVDARREVVGVELLLRWAHPSRGLLAPGVFLPLAEESSLILEIGAWVDAQARRLLQEWAQDDRLSRLTVAVNVSARQIHQALFFTAWDDWLRAHPRLAPRLELEITESVLIENLAQAHQVLAALAQREARLALDDFGTGYSSLSYLAELPFDTLKIDRAFVVRLDEIPRNIGILRSIFVLGSGLDMRTLAEGIEDEAQFALLRELGCQVFQGYLFGKPMPVEEFVAQMRGG